MNRNRSEPFTAQMYWCAEVIGDIFRIFNTIVITVVIVAVFACLKRIG